jgi:uncharacterized protein YwqG
MPETAPALHRFPELALLPVRGFDLRLHDGPGLVRLGLTEAMIRAYDDALWSRVAFPAHKMGGWAHPIQDPMEQQCALVTAGLYLGDGKVWRSDEGRRILAEPNDWVLLLQLDDDEDAGMQWGDTARLFVWIRAADLKDARFDRVWLIVQPT